MQVIVPLNREPIFSIGVPGEKESRAAETEDERASSVRVTLTALFHSEDNNYTDNTKIK